MFSCSAPEITFSREGRRGDAKDAESARRLRGLCAFFAASALNVFFWVPRNNAFNAKDAEETRRTRRELGAFAAFAPSSRPPRFRLGSRNNAFNAKDTEETRRTRRELGAFAAFAPPSRPPRRMFSSGFPEITPLTRRTRRKLGAFAAAASNVFFRTRVPVPENSPSGAGRPLWRLAVEFEVGDQAFVAFDAVILLAAVGLFLDQQDVGVGGGEDAEVARAETDLGELFPERGERGTLAGVDQLDQAFRGDAGLGEALLVGGERGGFGGGRLLARPGALGELAAVLVVARFEALQQHRGRHLAGVDPLLGARPGLDEEMAHRRHRDLGKARGADRRAPVPLFLRAGKCQSSPVIGGGRRRRLRRGGAEIDIVLFAQRGKLAAVLRLPLVAVLSRHDIDEWEA